MASSWTRRLPSVVAAVLVTACAAPAGAQGLVEPRSGQGLFGGIRPDANATHRLDFTVSLTEGYDDDVPAGVQSVIDSGSLQTGGFTTIVNGTAGYFRRGRSADVAVNASSTLRHYAELGTTRSVGHSAGVGITGHITGQTDLLVNQSASYSPTYLYSLFPTGATVQPGDAGTTTSDFAVSDRESYTYTTTATLTHDFTPRAGMDAGGELRYTDRLRETDLWSDVSAYTLHGRYSHAVARYVRLNAGARYRSGEFGYTREGLTTELRGDFGVSFSRPLSASRETALRFNVGITGVDLPEGRTGVAGDLRQYQTVADVSYVYQFGRTWQVQTSARRGLEYLADLPEPVSADGFTAGVDGLFSRRVDFAASVGYSNGESILNRDGLQFDTYSGSAQVRVALGRTVATYVQYLYYYYDFRGTTALVTGVPPGLERQGVRVGLTLWAPALRR